MRIVNLGSGLQASVSPGSVRSQPGHGNRWRHTPAALAVFLVMLPPSALAVSRSCGADPAQNTETVLCGPPSGPCTATTVTLSADIEVTAGGCEFALGGRALKVERKLQMAGFGFVKIVDAGDVTVTPTGKLAARGDFVEPNGFIIPGGLISLSVAGSIVHEGILDVAGDGAGSIRLVATGDVILAGGSAIHGNGITSFVDQGERFPDGGLLEVQSLAGSVRIAGDIALRGANQALGGQVAVTAARDCEVTRPIDLTGGGGDGGMFDAEAGDHIRITQSIDVSSRVGGGYGGDITLLAGADDLGGVIPGGDVTVDGAVLKLEGSASDQFGGDGGQLDVAAYGTVRFIGVGAAIRANAAANFDGSGGWIILDAGAANPYVLEPRDGDLILEGTVTAQSGTVAGDGGLLDIRAGRNLTLCAEVNLNGEDQGGDVAGEAGGTITLDGVITTRGTRGAGQGGFVEFEAGLAQGGSAGRLTAAKNILASGGASSAGRQVISLAGCELTVSDAVKIDGHGGVDANGQEGGADVMLIARAPMQLGANSQYLAGPGGSILTTHPPGQEPAIAVGVTFDPPRTDNPIVAPFPNCPICGDGVLQLGEWCDDGVSNGIDDCCTSLCQLVDEDGDGRCDRDDPCPADPDNDGDGDGFCVGAAFDPPAIGGGDPCSRLGTAGAWLKPKVVFAHLDGPSASGKLSLQGSFVIPPDGPPIAPELYGMQIRIVDSSGTLVVDAHLPAGAFSAGSPVGWTVKGDPPAKWTYLDKVHAPSTANGIDKLVVADRSRKVPGLFRIALTGKHGTYAFGSDPEPLRLTVELNDTGVPPGSTPGVDQCAEVLFALPPLAPFCQFHGVGTLTCK